MMILRLSLLAVALSACLTEAVVVNKRREGFDSYGPPPRPAPQYGPPPRQPHREYGVPQQIPFREYGPPALKYGPPKLNFLGGGGGGGSGGGGGGIGGGNFGNGLHEQIKSHFGVPKPFYGPPHIQHKPSGSYGPPPLPKPQAQYGPPPRPAPQYGPPPRPAPQYGPPPRPAPQYGPPPPQSLPAPHPAPIFNPDRRPATSYGPPPSGPLNLPPKQIYGPPKPGYGPPPLPLNLPGPAPPPNFNQVPETTIILTSSGHGGGHGGHNGGIGGHGGGHGGHGGHGGPSGPGGPGGPIKQVQIQIDASGHTHSVSGSQAPFHTACDGWKPIPAPIGAYIENNNIDTQSGYSHVSQGSFGTQYSGGSGGVGGVGGGTGIGISTSGGGGGGGDGGLIGGLTDEQLVAVALQSGGFDGPKHGPLPPTGPSGDFQHHNINSIDSEALQISVSGGGSDSYSKPPPDSFAPGSVHAQKYNTINGGPGGFGLTPPGANYGPPPSAPSGGAFIHEQHSSSAAAAGLGIQYGTQSGNTLNFPPHGGVPPSKPVAFRPPVPQGLLESIGATVQHLDQFGVKPPVQPPTYIPPAANEIADSGPGNAAPEYGAPPPPPPVIIEQQLPQQQHGHAFVQEQHGGALNQYGPPPQPPPPQQQYLPPPPPQGRPIGPPNEQYLPPPPTGPGGFQQGGAFEHAYSSSQYNQQFVHAQGLPLQQEPRFNRVHDCGQGPNLVGAGYQFQQQHQQQQQQQYSSDAGASLSSYNAIAQSIPVAEQHTQFVAGPMDSYGPPASGNGIDGDHDGYASQKSAVAALPDGTDPQNLPGLDGLDVISAQKSQSIQLSDDQTHGHQHSGAQPTFQLQIAGNAGGAHHSEQASNHEEILSEGLLQSILTAIEQPRNKEQHHHLQEQLQQQQHQQTLEHLYNHNAQARADTDISEDATPDDEDEPALAASSNVELKPTAEDAPEAAAVVQELKPIVAEELEEHAANSDDDNDDDDDAKH